MIQPVAVSLTALLLASGLAFAQPAAEAPKTEAPKVEAPSTVVPQAAEAPKVEAPKAVEAPKTEAPKVEAPKAVEAPKTEAPKAAEAPKTEAPKVEAPKAVEAPKTEAPKVEAPKAVEAPKTEAPKVEPPKAAEAPKAPPPKAEYQPQVGQAGKDVIWVPTPQETVDRMLAMAKAKPGDYVIDLGSGDGRTVITAAKRGIRAMGVEYNPDMVELSRRNAAKEGMADRAIFVQGDIFKTDFSQATVLTMYLLPRLNIQLRPTILAMKPGTRVVSHSFHMEDWEADDAFDSKGDKCKDYCQGYLWIVPARVEGKWRTSRGRLTIEQQKFQKFTGSMKRRGKTVKIEDGRVRGEEISFTAGGRKYTGTVKGKKIKLKRVKA